MNLIKRFFVKEEVEIPDLIPHDHEWQLITKTYGDPRHDVVAGFSDPETVDRALFGITNLLFQCVICKNFKVEALTGTDVPSLLQLIEKVNTYGPQYYQKENTTYIIQKYNTPRIDPSTNLPIR